MLLQGCVNVIGALYKHYFRVMQPLLEGCENLIGEVGMRNFEVGFVRFLSLLSISRTDITTKQTHPRLLGLFCGLLLSSLIFWVKRTIPGRNTE